MPEVNSYRGISIGDKVICIDKKMHAYGRTGIVKSIKSNEGAENGWFKGILDHNGRGFLFAGEEIIKYEEKE